ncbi:DUF1877 family protein [Streptomyces inhibens]|uniref:DUF1877 family protein n=1 Tax=Streptomyces inhibens TaxID=2293571 RepID=UPI0037BBBC6A
MGVSIGSSARQRSSWTGRRRNPTWADEYVYELYAGDDLSIRDRPYGGPDKAWAGLQLLLDETDVELEFLMDGFQILEDGTLFGWTAEQIESVARELRATPVGAAGGPLRPGADDEGAGIPTRRAGLARALL